MAQKYRIFSSWTGYIFKSECYASRLNFHGGLLEMSLGQEYLLILGNDCICYKTPNGKVLAWIYPLYTFMFRCYFICFKKGLLVFGIGSNMGWKCLCNQKFARSSHSGGISVVLLGGHSNNKMAGFLVLALGLFPNWAVFLLTNRRHVVELELLEIDWLLPQYLIDSRVSAAKGRDTISARA